MQSTTNTKESLEPQVNDGPGGAALTALITSPSSLPLDGSGDTQIKRKRGRPPKTDPLPTVLTNSPSEPSSVKRRRGRPPKKLALLCENEEKAKESGDGGKELILSKEKETIKISDEIDSNQEGIEANIDEPQSRVRISRRLAKKRECGYVVPWKSLMTGIKDDPDDLSPDESPPRECDSSEAAFIITNKPTKTGGRRGRPPKNKYLEKSEKKPKELSDELKSLQTAITQQEAILQEVTGEQEDVSIFDHAAAKITKQLPGTPEEIKATLEDIALEAQLSGFEIRDNAVYVYGSLEALLKAKTLITDACMAAIPGELDSKDKCADTSQATLNATKPKNGEEEEDEPEVEEGDIEDQEEEGIEKTDKDTAVMINPTTGKRYTRLCAIYKNPENATAVCNLCNFVTTEGGMLKHKVRQHPDTVFECEICLQKFGVRYDMRRHRISHFDSAGRLKPCFEPFFRKRFPDIVGPITLALLEQDYSPPEMAALELGEGAAAEGGTESTEEPGKGTDSKDVNDEETGEMSELQDSEKKDNEKIEGNEDLRPEDTVEEEEQKLSASQLKRLSMLNMCEYCDFTGFKAIVDRHKMRSHPLYLYKCPNCEMEIGDFQEIVKHYAKHHNVTPSYVDKHTMRQSIKVACCQCGVVDTETNIKIHNRLHHPAHWCRHCNKYFLDGRKIQAHFRTIHRKLFNLVPSKGNKGKGAKQNTNSMKCGKKNRSGKLKLPPDSGRQPCGQCGASVRLSWYHQHMKTHKREMLQCDQCDFKTDLRFQLKNHKLNKHGPKQFMCDICGQTFTFKQTQKVHMKVKHSEKPESFQCEHCEKWFSERRFLTTHIKRMHLKEKKYYCDVCNRGFFEKIRMKQHREVHLSQQDKDALKQYQCKYCMLKFRDSSRLAQHENIHTGNTPFKCKQCDKAFRWSSELSKHVITIHNEKRRFQCTICHKSFKFRYKLNSHMIVHTQERKYYCEECHRVFTSITTFRKHRCRLLMLGESQTADKDKEQLQLAANGSHETIGINVEIPETAVMSSEELANLQAAGGAEDGSVTFMCGICHQLFSTANEINQHVLQAHEDSRPLVDEKDNNNGILEEGTEEEHQLGESEGASLVIEVDDNIGEARVDFSNQENIQNVAEEMATAETEDMVGNSEEEESTMSVQVMDLNRLGDSIQVIHIDGSDATMGEMITVEEGNPVTAQVIIDGQLHQVIHGHVEEDYLGAPEMQVENVQSEDEQKPVSQVENYVEDQALNDRQILVEIQSDPTTEEKAYSETEHQTVTVGQLLTNLGQTEEEVHIQTDHLVGTDRLVHNITRTEDKEPDTSQDHGEDEKVAVLQIMEGPEEGEAECQVGDEVIQVIQTSDGPVEEDLGQRQLEVGVTEK